MLMACVEIELVPYRTNADPDFAWIAPFARRVTLVFMAPARDSTTNTH